MKKLILFLILMSFSCVNFSFSANKINANRAKNISLVTYATFTGLGNQYSEGTYSYEYLCYSSTPPLLPTISDNGIVGVWYPSVIDYSINQNYHFYPNAGQSAVLATVLYVSPDLSIVPNFNVISSFYAEYISIGTLNAVPDLLPISDNGIIGTWSPNVISNVSNGNYIFTPNNSCYKPFTLYVWLYTPEDSYCATVVYLETEELNDFIHQELSIKTLNNYLVSGNNTIELEGVFHVELLPNSSIESNNFVEARINEYGCTIERLGSSLIGEEEIGGKNLSIFPNPSSNSVEISMKNTTFNKVLINSIDGKTVFDKNIDNSESFQVDVSNYANGLYIVNVIDKEGQVYNQKLIKN